MWNRYDQLVSKRENETLTGAEFEELKSLTDNLEQQNVRRIHALAKLAALRNKSLDMMMKELQIEPHNRLDRGSRQ